MSVDRLILGTAGLGGQPYGRNKRTVTTSEAEEVIRYAAKLGIRAFDTAPAYGFAEDMLGHLINYSQIPKSTIYTKTTGDIDGALASIHRLRCVPVFLYHNYQVGTSLQRWMSGVTVYSNDNVRTYGVFDLEQSDWNLLNQSAPRPIARSVFLQGVLAGDGAPVPELESWVDRARRMAIGLKMSLKQLALGAALGNKDIKKVVVGATSKEEVREAVEIAKASNYEFLYPAVQMLDCPDRNLTDPRKWPQ